MHALARPLSCAFPALATLAVLGLAAAQPQAACAQSSLTLNGNDSATVNGAGTVGTVGGMVYLPGQNTTKSYSDTSTQYAVETNDASTFTLGSGGTLTASQQGDAGLIANGTGAVTVSGGTINAGQYGAGLLANDTGTVTVTGGTISAGEDGVGLDAGGSGAVNISGGTLTGGQHGYGLYNGTEAVNISGGTLSGGYYGLFDAGGTVTLTGGTLTGGAYGLVASGGVIDLYGSFAGLAPGQTESLPSSGNGDTGSFVGTLEDNTVGQTFTYQNYGTITLHDVALAATPEPSSVAAFACAGLGVAGLMLRARKRSTHAG